jgi:acetylornithine deacetylase/succinyl-diaminopimelate desuccinylase-like protein
MQIQQIPAPTFAEAERAKFVRALFEGEGLEVSVDEVGNVYGRWTMDGGRRTKDDGWRAKVKPLIVSAHLDTVFPADTDLRLTRRDDRIHGPGLGDNSLGVAALFGVLWGLRERVPPLPVGEGRGEGDIYFVANVGEEGLGDLRGMKAVADRFGPDVKAYLVLEGLALGHVYHRALGVKRYRITAKTPGGHSWTDYGRPSAIHELAKFAAELTSMKLPESPRTTMNVGRISGGISVNVIASEASLELDLRSEGRDQLTELIARVEKKMEKAGRAEVKFEAELIGERPAGEIDPNHPLIQLALECVREQGLEPSLTSGSTDANLPLSRGYPALVLGITTGGGAHTVNEFINATLVEKGMQQLVRFVGKAVSGTW